MNVGQADCTSKNAGIKIILPLNKYKVINLVKRTRSWTGLDLGSVLGQEGATLLSCFRENIKSTGSNINGPSYFKHDRPATASR